MCGGLQAQRREYQRRAILAYHTDTNIGRSCTSTVASRFEKRKPSRSEYLGIEHGFIFRCAIQAGFALSQGLPQVQQPPITGKLRWLLISGANG